MARFVTAVSAPDVIGKVGETATRPLLFAKDSAVRGGVVGSGTLRIPRTPAVPLAAPRTLAWQEVFRSRLNYPVDAGKQAGNCVAAVRVGHRAQGDDLTQVVRAGQGDLDMIEPK